mmetsp:Transcript_90268/g.291896  ORF Transcript_90268/g.291896 Transcript_90268/m.291896 type:complete len:231 (+) Transcript_90268:140-832(+)
MGKVKQTRRQLSKFFNWRCSVTLIDGRVLVGTLMAVDRHVNLVLCNTEEYRKYKVKGKPEGKELKRMLGFIVVRGTEILYVQPEECGKEELVETDKSKKIKAAPKAEAKGGSPVALGLPGMLPGLPGMLPGMRMPTLGGMQLPPGFNPMMMGTRPGGLPGMPGLPNFAGMPGMAGLAGLNLPKAGLPPGFPGGMAFPGLGGMTFPGLSGGMTFPGLGGMTLPGGMGMRPN